MAGVREPDGVADRLTTMALHHPETAARLRRTAILMAVGVFVLTASFTVDFLRPVASGSIRAEGRVVNISKRRILADAELHDDSERLVARGRGTFMRSNIALGPEVGYRE